jgi:predicted nuclease with TOPRIM domain
MNLSPKKFEYKEGKKHDISAVENRIARAFSKGETKEAARTLSNGTRNYGLRKGLPKAKVIPNSAVSEEVQSLRQKNVEYQKALNVFREKLNEVAVFNSNLAYATRLFTEHPTSKQEKINILRRFDDVESIKESKNLYNSIKNELTNSSKNVVTESMEKIEKTHSSGSSQNLIESKTYENPQFLRMKDIMQKINK